MHALVNPGDFTSLLASIITRFYQWKCTQSQHSMNVRMRWHWQWNLAKMTYNYAPSPLLVPKDVAWCDHMMWHVGPPRDFRGPEAIEKQEGGKEGMDSNSGWIMQSSLIYASGECRSKVQNATFQISVGTFHPNQYVTIYYILFFCRHIFLRSALAGTKCH